MKHVWLSWTPSMTDRPLIRYQGSVRPFSKLELSAGSTKLIVGMSSNDRVFDWPVKGRATTGGEGTTYRSRSR